MSQRYVVLATPREATILPVGDPRRHDRYRRHQPIAQVRIPRRIPVTHALLAAIRDDITGRTTWS